MRRIVLASLICLSGSSALGQTAAPPGTPIAPVASDAPPPPETPPPPPPPSAAPPAPLPPQPPPPGAQPPPPQPPPGTQPPPGQQYPPGAPYPPGTQYPPGYYPPPPGYYYPPPGYAYPPGYGYPPPGEQPPAPKKPDTSKRNHDGFYLRMGMGPGYGRVVAEGASSDVKATYTGWGPAFELLLGGTLGSGFVLGGGFVGQDVSEPDLEVESGGVSLSGTVDNESLGILTLGPFVDWYPDPKGGAHVGLMIGPAEVGLQDDDGQSSTGIGGSLFGGYDFWIGEQWSLGVEGRVVAASTEHTRNDADFENTATSYQVLFTALLH